MVYHLKPKYICFNGNPGGGGYGFNDCNNCLILSNNDNYFPLLTLSHPERKNEKITFLIEYKYKTAFLLHLILHYYRGKIDTSTCSLQCLGKC